MPPGPKAGAERAGAAVVGVPGTGRFREGGGVRSGLAVRQERGGLIDADPVAAHRVQEREHLLP